MREMTKAALFAALLVALIALALAITSSCGPAARGAVPSGAKPAVPPETSVHYAVKYARMSSPGRGPQLVGEPTEVRGKVMAHEESERFRPGGQRHWKSQEERDLPVWLIAIQGDFQVPGGSDDAYAQEIVVLDAHTAEYLGSSNYPVGREVDTSSLAVLSLPAGPDPTPFASYTPAPASTPAPTKPAAPAIALWPGAQYPELTGPGVITYVRPGDSTIRNARRFVIQGVRIGYSDCRMGPSPPHSTSPGGPIPAGQVLALDPATCRYLYEEGEYVGPQPNTPHRGGPTQAAVTAVPYRPESVR